jgi:hypothetical protein
VIPLGRDTTPKLPHRAERPRVTGESLETPMAAHPIYYDLVARATNGDFVMEPWYGVSGFFQVG